MNFVGQPNINDTEFPRIQEQEYGQVSVKTCSDITP